MSHANSNDKIYTQWSRQPQSTVINHSPIPVLVPSLINMLCSSWHCAVWHNCTFSALGVVLRCTDCSDWDVLFLQKRWALLLCVHSLHTRPWLQCYTEELYEKHQDFWKICISNFGCLCLIPERWNFCSRNEVGHHILKVLAVLACVVVCRKMLLYISESVWA